MAFATEYGKIEMIKMFRTLTNMGLVDSKLAVEIFNHAQGALDDRECKLTHIGEMRDFIFFCGLFTRNMVKIQNGNIYPVDNQPYTLSDLRNLYKLR